MYQYSLEDRLLRVQAYKIPAGDYEACLAMPHEIDGYSIYA